MYDTQQEYTFTNLNTNDAKNDATKTYIIADHIWAIGSNWDKHVGGGFPNKTAHQNFIKNCA